jgi:hypothetical protein
VLSAWCQDTDRYNARRRNRRHPSLPVSQSAHGLLRPGVPMECSSGERERRGPITKAGNIHARRLLVEAAWNNRHNAGADLILNRRRQGQAPEIVAIAIKAQHRLTHKFWRLDQRKHRLVAITAVARELCGFVWAILNAAPQSQTNWGATRSHVERRASIGESSYEICGTDIVLTRVPRQRLLRTNTCSCGNPLGPCQRATREYQSDDRRLLLSSRPRKRRLTPAASISLQQDHFFRERLASCLETAEVNS